jgi:hypothetical protein
MTDVEILVATVERLKFLVNSLRKKHPSGFPYCLGLTALFGEHYSGYVGERCTFFVGNPNDAPVSEEITESFDRSQPRRQFYIAIFKCFLHKGLLVETSYEKSAI